MGQRRRDPVTFRPQIHFFMAVHSGTTHLYALPVPRCAAVGATHPMLPLHLFATCGKGKGCSLYVGVCNMTAPFETVIG